MTMKLCYCNNCDSVLEDENPQANAKEYPDYISVPSLERREDSGGAHWACPNCNTDSYLSDHIPQKVLDKVLEYAAEKAFFKSHPELNP